jgi:hypothetical protein
MKQEMTKQKGGDMENLSLGGTTKNVTPQISKTHPTLEQHRIHIKKTFQIIYQKVTQVM